MKRGEVPPRSFTLAVLSTAKSVFGRDAKYITKTRAIKLVCMVADDLGIESIPRGWYQHGIYSFKVDSIVQPYFRGGNLLTASIPAFSLPSDLMGAISHRMKNLKEYFVQPATEFMDWIHFEKAPEPYKKFYQCHRELTKVLDSLIEPQPQEMLFSTPYDSVAETITRYNTCLGHVPESLQNLFFDYTDVLEDLLLVVKRRGLGLSEVRDILSELREIYGLIYPCITPFEQSVRGIGREEEIKILRQNTEKRYITTMQRLCDVRKRMEERGLMPTLEEYDGEILEGMNAMIEDERSKLVDVFKV